jgi:hypothetical protein
MRASLAKPLIGPRRNWRSVSHSANLISFNDRSPLSVTPFLAAMLADMFEGSCRTSKAMKIAPLIDNPVRITGSND